MVLLLTGLAINILGPTGPALMHHLSRSPHDVGLIFSAEGLGSFCGSALAGSILSRFSPHSVVSAACALLFVSLGVVPSCSALSQVMLMYLCAGAAAGLANTTANTMVTWAWRGSAGRLGAVLNFVNACFPLGGTAAPLLLLLCGQRIGNPLVAFSLIAVLALLPMTGAALLQTPAPPPPPPLEPPSPPKRRGSCDTLGSSSAVGGSSLCGIDLGSRPAYVRWTVLAPLLVTIWLCIGAEIAYAAWVYSYATHQAGMGSHQAAYLTSLYWSAFTVARLGATPLAACVTPGAILVPAMALEVLLTSYPYEQALVSLRLKKKIDAEVC